MTLNVDYDIQINLEKIDNSTLIENKTLTLSDIDKPLPNVRDMYLEDLLTWLELDYEKHNERLNPVFYKDANEYKKVTFSISNVKLVETGNFDSIIDLRQRNE